MGEKDELETKSSLIPRFIYLELHHTAVLSASFFASGDRRNLRRTRWRIRAGTLLSL
jgi:hypothetical protein